MVIYRIGDARPDFNFTIRNNKGDILDLTGSTADVKIRKIPDAGETVSSNKIEEAAVPVDLPNGSPHYQWSPATDDFEAGDEGNYKAWLKATLSDGDPLTSSKEYVEIKAEED